MGAPDVSTGDVTLPPSGAEQKVEQRRTAALPAESLNVNSYRSPLAAPATRSASRTLPLDVARSVMRTAYGYTGNCNGAYVSVSTSDDVTAQCQHVAAGRVRANRCSCPTSCSITASVFTAASPAFSATDAVESTSTGASLRLEMLTTTLPSAVRPYVSVTRTTSA